MKHFTRDASHLEVIAAWQPYAYDAHCANPQFDHSPEGKERYDAAMNAWLTKLDAARAAKGLPAERDYIPPQPQQGTPK
jgi:hypothetical protein